MSLNRRLERWGRGNLSYIIAVGMIASVVCMYLLPVAVGWQTGCTIGAVLFFACCFYLYVRARVGRDG